MAKNNIKSKVMAGALALALTGGAFAYFSDYATTSATGKAGTLGIGLTSTYSEEAMGLLDPGDTVPFEFSIVNTGNKLMQIRETVSIKASKDGKPLNFSDPDAHEFLLVDEEGNEVAVDKRTVKGNEIKYVIESGQILDGNASINPRETAENRKVEDKGALKADRTKRAYKLKFRNGADNKWQSADVEVDYLVEGRQFLNNDSTWEALQSETVKLNGEDTKVVPKATVEKAAETEKPGSETVQP